MARYPLGQPVRVPWNTYQADGRTLVDATGNSLTVKVTNVDGTSTATAGSPYTSPVHDSTATYHQDVPATDLTTLGHYQWVATSTGTGAGAAFGDFDVFDPFEPALLPLQDAYDTLNIPAAQQTGAVASEISQYIATIQASLEAMTGGPLINRTVVERAEFSCDMRFLPLRQRPIVSVTSIVSIPNGASVDLSGGLDIDKLGNVVYPQSNSSFSAFSRLATATYVAGWGTQMPAAFNVTARIILAFLWSTQHGPSARPSMGGPASDLVSVPGFAFDIPGGAAELLRGTLNGLPFICQVFA